MHPLVKVRRQLRADAEVAIVVGVGHRVVVHVEAAVRSELDQNLIRKSSVLDA
jgi:hypothetical protein